tara:strand:+ start:89 stop:358 length:270 start_codon:yes stop_codon:yes gene_type:complete
MFNVRKKDIDSEYADTIDKLRKEKRTRAKEFAKNNSHDPQGLRQLQKLYDERIEKEREKYKSGLRKLQNSLFRQQSAEKHNKNFGTRDF